MIETLPGACLVVLGIGKDKARIRVLKIPTIYYELKSEGGDLISHIGRTPSLTFPPNLGKM